MHRSEAWSQFEHGLIRKGSSILEFVEDRSWRDSRLQRYRKPTARDCRKLVNNKSYDRVPSRKFVAKHPNYILLADYMIVELIFGDLGRLNLKDYSEKAQAQNLRVGPIRFLRLK